MTLDRLIEMIREDCAGADDWPVLFAAYRKSRAGEWQEVDVREPVTAVQVDTKAQEVLLIRNPTGTPLAVSSLIEKLSGLLACHSGFTVDTCEPPIVDAGALRIDLPIVGVGRNDARRCYLLVFASSMT